MTQKQKKEIAEFVLMGKELQPQATEMELILHFVAQSNYRTTMNDMIDIFGLIRELQSTIRLKKTERVVNGQTYVYVEIA